MHKLVSIIFLGSLITLNEVVIASNVKLYDFNHEIGEIENKTGGVVSLSFKDTNTGQQLEYKADKLLPMGCTSKVMGGAAILEQSQQKKIDLSTIIAYPDPGEHSWSPVTKKYVKTGMTIKDLAGAAISYSDNTAMNLLTMQLGGPNNITKFARSIGDHKFNLTNWWPKEAYSGLGDTSDQSTVNAMTNSIYKLIFGSVLNNKLRQQLESWMIENKTGNKRIRAGLPKSWKVGDKTGTGAIYGTTNDTAFFWPLKCRKPIIATIFYTNRNKQAPTQDNVIAQVTRLSIQKLAEDVPCLRDSLTA